MTSQSFDEMLADAKLGSGGAPEIDTSFLDSFRETGKIPHPEPEVDEPASDDGERDGLDLVPEGEPVQVDEAGELDESVIGPEHEVAPEGDDERDAEAGEHDEPEIERDREEDEKTSETSDQERGDKQSQRGGDGGSNPAADAAATAAAVVAGAAAPREEQPTEQILIEEQSSEAPVGTTGRAAKSIQQRKKDISTRRKSDQQDAIQAASTGKKGGSGSDDGGTLPRSGFALPEVSSAPLVRNLPDELVLILRSRLKTAAVRERGVSEAVAAAFSEQLSQSALAMAFMLAQLDVRMDADPATTVAIELFRSQDPLLGAVVDRMDVLESREREQTETITTLVTLLREVKTTGDVVEQAVAYSIADRTENLARGMHTVDSINLGHKSAIAVRDRAREDTRKRQTYEKERDGRPIR